MGTGITVTGLERMELACFFSLADINKDGKGPAVIKYGGCGLGIGRVALSDLCGWAHDRKRFFALLAVCFDSIGEFRGFSKIQPQMRATIFAGLEILWGNGYPLFEEGR